MHADELFLTYSQYLYCSLYKVLNDSAVTKGSRFKIPVIITKKESKKKLYIYILKEKKRLFNKVYIFIISLILTFETQLSAF